MELIRLENYGFTYSGGDIPAVCDVNFSVMQGDFIVVIGESGCGKTTLLKSMKPEVTPCGTQTGKIFFEGIEWKNENCRDFSKIGYVMQNPDSQIVCDSVWHELSFGLENMGMSTDEMRVRVAEVATFFGIEKWFTKSVWELSGGQRQILNLASVMVCEPEIIILDEPTSHLNPISSSEFFDALKKINDELGTTVILCEHKTDEVFSLANRVVVVENGKIIADDVPSRVGKILKNADSKMYSAMPSSVQISEEIDGLVPSAVSVKEARKRVAECVRDNCVSAVFFDGKKERILKEKSVEVKDLSFRYEKNQPYVLSDLSFEVKKGEIFGILGGNGSGKSTILKILSGIIEVKKGKIKIFDKVGYLPQNPESLFLCDMVSEELKPEGMELLKKFGMDGLKTRHPLDLSGGEKQKLALCKVLQEKPEILLLDEPTKGFDATFKAEFGKIVEELSASGVTVVMVSHDIEFCASVCDRCALLFDGNFASVGISKDFFGGKKFYTTQTGRIFKGIADGVVLLDDGIELIRLWRESV